MVISITFRKCYNKNTKNYKIKRLITLKNIRHIKPRDLRCTHLILGRHNKLGQESFDKGTEYRPFRMDSHGYTPIGTSYMCDGAVTGFTDKQ